MTEDTDEKVPLVIVGTGTMSPRDMEQLLSGQWVEIYEPYCEYRTRERTWYGRTIFKSQRANNIPTNPTHVDPPNLHPALSLASCGITEEGNKLTVGRPPIAAPDARVIRDFDQTILVDVSVVQECRVLADVNPRFCPWSIPREIAGGCAEPHHLPYQRAETLDGGQRWPEVDHPFLNGNGPRGPFGLDGFSRFRCRRLFATEERHGGWGNP